MDEKQMTEKVAGALTGPAGTGWVESVSILEPDGRGYPIGLELESGELWFITVQRA